VRSRLRREGLRLSLLGLLVGSVMLTLLVGSAAAAPSCTTTAGVTTCTFAYSGASQQWTVPAGITRATFNVLGAEGGRGALTGFGGTGGAATATFAVQAGQVFEVVVGGKGGDDPLLHGGDGAGGFNGGATSAGPTISGGGGGGSDIRAGACASTTSCGFDSRIIAAGGGGGGGGGSNANGGAGGGLAGNDGDGDSGGKAGTAGAGGEGGDPAAGDGDFGSGGAGSGGSAGGGGGWYGGGGGAGDGLSSSGGGGGSGFVDPSAISSSLQAGGHIGDGLVTITYAPPSADVAVSIAGPASATRGTQVSYLITVSNAGPDTAHNVVLTNPIPSGASFLGVSTTKGTCTPPKKGAPITCAIGDLASGDGSTNSVSIKVTAKAGSNIVNIVSANSTANGAGSATSDPDSSNNAMSLSTTVTK
jgi:uncharacterized repeat protein (TIGR01451 family)